MAISSPTAIKFSDNRVRPSSDRLTQFYRRCVDVQPRWTALGGGQGAINVMGPDIVAAANAGVAAYEFCFRTEKSWFLLGATTLFPNDTSQVWDNATLTAQDTTRPPLTGADVVRVIDRVVQFQNWLLSAAGSFTDATRASAAIYNTILAPSSDGPAVMTVADAGNFITRCGEIKTNYEATANQNLGFLLKASVNPNP